MNLPYVRSLTVVRKTSAVGAAPDVATVSYYLGSRLPGPAQDFAAAMRGHWGGGEIRNHGVRDALWAAARTRSKNWHLNANLAVRRTGLLAPRAQRAAHLTWPVRFELAAQPPAFPFRLVTKPAPN